MDPNLPNQQESQQPEKRGLLKALALLEVGLIEIFFVSIVLILFFGILNYFNILRLSEIFPNYLGFLPHRAYQQLSNSAMKQSVNVTIVPSPTLSLSDSAKQTLNNFLPTILSPVLVPDPSQVTIKQDKNISTTFISSWDIKESTVAAIFATTDGQNISQAYLSFQKSQNIAPSVELASTIISEFFSIKPKGVWGCKPLSNNTLTYCENFWEENNGIRKGIGMQGLFTKGPNRINNSPEVMIFFCQHSKDSKLYSWKSCEYEFAQTGVR